MAFERNAPCPCGSGKKYKKCCLAQDEAAKQEERAKAQAALAMPKLPPLPERKPKPPKPPDPFMDAWNARWEEFDKAEYEDSMALFARTIEEGELMDGEMVSEMTGQLFGQAIENNDRDRFDALLEQLHERLPDVYDEEAHWLIGYQIKNALATGRFDKIAPLVQSMAALIPEHIDVWNALEEELAYYAQLEALLDAMRAAWPKVQTSAEIVPWGKDGFASRAAQYEMLWQLAQSADAHADDPALQERMRFFLGDDLDVERTADSLSWLSGQTTRTWTLDDFPFVPSHQSKKGLRREAQKLADDNLHHLLLQFTRYLHDETDVPLVKAELAGREIYSYLIKRQDGELEYQESMLDAAMRSAGQNLTPLKKFAPVTHPLCPDAERLEAFFALGIGFISLRRFAFIAQLEFTPLWVRFLAAQGLLDQTDVESTLRSLKKVADGMLPLIRQEIDPAQVLRHWET